MADVVAETSARPRFQPGVKSVAPAGYSSVGTTDMACLSIVRYGQSVWNVENQFSSSF